MNACCLATEVVSSFVVNKLVSEVGGGMCVGGLGPGGTRGSAQLAYVSVTVLVPYTYVPNPVIYMLTVPYTRSSIRNALAIYCYNALHNKIRSLDFDCNEMK